MALQRADDEDGGHDGHRPRQSIRQRLRAIVGGRAVPELEPHVAQHETQCVAQHGTQHAAQHEVQHDNPHETPHGNPRDEPYGSPQDILFQRVGDTIVLNDSAVPVPADPLAEARAFLLYLQPELGGAWIAHKDLGDRLYPAFCQVINRADDLSWGSVARAFGRITKKRRRAVVQYYIPRPRRGAG